VISIPAEFCREADPLRKKSMGKKQTVSEGVRINKFLASCGLGSRRSCEKIVEQGGVTINGTSVTSLGARVLASDSVKIDGRRVRPPGHVTILLNKPKGLICTKEDTHDRDTIYELLPGRHHRLNYIGRLDKESEGLLLLTSDGELSQQLTHPKHGVEKEYRVLLDRTVEKEHAEQMLKGIHTAEGIARAERIEAQGARWISVVLKQGLKRQIRIMLGKFDYKVRRLIRVRIGDLIAPDLKAGNWVELEADGIELAQTNPRPAAPQRT
jgi:23S rRNA pseudouridine2605 synthase